MKPHGLSTRQEVHSASTEDQGAWNELVDRLPGSSFCHRFEWLVVFRLAYRKQCHYLYASEGGQWSGVLPLVHMRGPLAHNRLVSLPFLDQGGILAESPQAAQALRLEAFRLAGLVGATGVEFRGDAGPSPPDPARSSRYRFILSLGSSREAVWGAIGPKVRNQVRKSEKSGLATYRVDTNRLDDFYRIWARNMRDLGSPAHSARFFHQVLASLGSSASLYLVENEGGTPVAGAIAIRFGDCVTVPWASSLRSARPACPNHALYWGILRDAVGGGAKNFDFGRSSEGTGTYHFKKQWRARPESLSWHSYDSTGSLEPERPLSLRKKRFLAGLWRRLPVSLATRVGPLVRRQIPL